MIEDDILEQLFHEEMNSAIWILLIKKIAASTSLTQLEVQEAITECKRQRSSVTRFKNCVRNKLEPDTPNPPNP